MAVSRKPARNSNRPTNNITETPKTSQPVAPIVSQSAPKPSTPSYSGLHMVPPSEEQVRRRAYEIYESQGRPEGRQEEHWRQAEAEIRGRSA